ncbi:MAG: hypothetical protein ABI162_08300 [Luteolibacter sp.]
MNSNHHTSLKHYLNDVIDLERNIRNAVHSQSDDSGLQVYPELRQILLEIVKGSDERIAALEKLSAQEGGSVGAALMEGINTVTGTLVGLYDKVREHPVSKMLRDDIIALHLASTSYGMLLTLSLGIGHNECADLALKCMSCYPHLILGLTDLLPTVVLEELAQDAPLTSPAAAQVAITHIRDVWHCDALNPPVTDAASSINP